MVKEMISLGANGRKDDLAGWWLKVKACWRDICTGTYYKVQKE